MKKSMNVVLMLVLLAVLCMPAAFAAAADDVVVFTDPVLESVIRDQMGIPEGEITAQDAAAVEWLDGNRPGDTPDSGKIHDISALRWFTGLYGLRLDNNAIEDIWPIKELTNLHELWILDNPLTDLTPLAGLTSLEKLGFNAGLQDVTFLQNMPGLLELRIDGLRALPAGLPALAQLQVFCSLGGEVADIGVLAQCPGLTVIDLGWNLVSDLTPLQNLPLTELYLQGNPIADYSPVAALYPNLAGRDFEYYELMLPENPGAVIAFPDPALEQKVRAALDIPNGDITAGDAAQAAYLNIANDWQPQIPQEIRVTDLTGLEYFINLRELIGDFNAISDLGPLAGLSQLRRLNLGGNAVTDLTPLAGLFNLEDISLFDSRVSDISPLAGHASLRSLRLANNPVADLSPLAELTQLDSLYLGGCGIADIGALTGLTNMFCLELMDNYITDLSPLSGMQNLHILKLGNNPIADYAPIEAVYPQLEDRDFELGQTFDVDIPLEPENPDAAVEIPDAALEAILRETTGVYDRPLTEKDLCAIGKLVASDDAMWRDVQDIWPLRYCLNLEGLIINGSQVEALEGLSMLNKLSVLAVNDSRVTNIETLEPLADQLLSLGLKGNQIEDISVIAAMVNLESLDLSWNGIQDLSPLYGLTRLGKLMINHNLVEDASGLAGIAAGLKEMDFDPNQPLEPNQQGGEPEIENPDQAIVFPDPVLELYIRKAMNRPDGAITAGDAASVGWLSLGIPWEEAETSEKITDLSGIEYFIHLEGLELGNQAISDLTPLVGLKQLAILNLLNTGIADIGPLADIPSLQWLELRNNAIEDFSPLSGLTHLYGLLLQDNPSTDYTPLKELYPNLTEKDF